MSKIILDLCGGTGAWSRPYKEAGYDVRVITLPEFDITKTEYEDREIIFVGKTRRSVIKMNDVYGILAAPPCTMFSFARTKANKPRDIREGMRCVRSCLEVIWSIQEIQQDTKRKLLPLKFWALENPNGMLKFVLGNPSFIFNPWEFGDGYQKKTHLWGYFNPPKKTLTDKPNGDMALYKSLTPSKRIKFDKLHTKDIASEFYGKLTRTERRAITPRGFAEAFYKANK